MKSRFGIGSVSRPMALLLLVSVFVFQLISPSVHAATAMLDSQAQHKISMDTVSDCPMHLANMASTADSAPENGSTPEKCAHCVLSTCCFHVTFPSLEIVAEGVLLPDATLIDRGRLTTSSANFSQDRPPRHI